MTDQQVWERQTPQTQESPQTPQEPQQKKPRKPRSDLGGLRPHTKKPNYKARGPRPQCWIIKDEFAHRQYVAWLQHRNQAQWRREPYELTFEDYQTVWGDRWEQKGKSSTSYCLTRLDREQPWNLANTRCWQRRKAIQYQLAITTELKRRARG